MMILRHLFRDCESSENNRPVIRLNELAVGIEQLRQILHSTFHPTSCHAETKLFQVGRGSLDRTIHIVEQNSVALLLGC